MFTGGKQQNTFNLQNATSLCNIATTLPPCPANTVAVANGILQNILIQRNELTQLAAVNASLGNPTAFAAAKTQFINVINSGVAVRKANQALADPANLALVAGLATVEGAQAQELALATGLVGTVAADAKSIASLQAAFNGGIAKNSENVANALAVCTIF
ncbi:hypothetical protein M427DRAFT_98861 [Gonapodya prolifera JEL478]|uniref:Uncharacterized protein n=1 Tax=Gonapodya prolifera (strain JEL478) TaxID=1344416 RepID=A0A139AF34_GONPJ|nr:hypothetical protein M427DRAFT_98861 [Gonapodya prolifera JEL478]|eukprot:KXS15426.1 hypothetical protein M427DRAFT_98861 [Gonapodya prolifera JEL478]